MSKSIIGKVASLGILALPTVAQSSEQPNIVLFLVDDMGWQDTSEPFWTHSTPLNERYHTPNMERLSSQGVKFTEAYSCSVSSPTRISLLTGMNAAHHRVTNWTLRRNTSTDEPNDVLNFPLWNVNGITPFEGVDRATLVTPLPELLRKEGYRTIHCGKAHFGAIGTPGADPLNLGFDVNIAGHAAGGLGSYLGENNFGNNKVGPWGVPDLEEFHGHDIFVTEALTIKALRELEKNKISKQPFFLYMSHYAVHTPFNADKRFIDKYRAAGLEEVEAQYASMIEGMDKSLGDIMNYLEENNLSQNTIIIFLSDNGGLSAHTRGNELHTHNHPLASGKGSAYEGGIRVPMIVKWPETAKSSTTYNDYIIVEDLFPTLLDMAQVKDRQTIQQVDGVSFISVLKDSTFKNSNTRSLYWHYPHEWGVPGPGIGASSGIRKGDWKLIYFHADSRIELYNIKNDIGEYQNLVNSNKSKVRELAKELEDYLTSIEAQMPSYKSTGEIVPMPYTFLTAKRKR